MSLAWTDGPDTFPLPTKFARLGITDGEDDSSGISFQHATTGARGTSWLPPSRVPLGTAEVNMPDGTKQTIQVMIDPQWYRGFDELFNRRAGGVTGPTLATVETNATNAIAVVTDLAPAVAAAQQTANAVATAAIASRAVLVAAGTAGADQIPRVNPNNNDL